jgi:hypothetical protein
MPRHGSAGSRSRSARRGVHEIALLNLCSARKACARGSELLAEACGVSPPVFADDDAAGP